MVAKRTADLAEIAAGLTFPQYEELSRLFLSRTFGELEFAVITGRAKEAKGGSDFVLPITLRTAPGQRPRPS